MKAFLFACFTGLLFSCNSSSEKETTDIQNSDTISTTTKTDALPASADINIEPVKVSLSGIPAYLKFKGKAEEAWQWKDKLGDNLLIISFIAPFNDKNKDEEGQTAELHAFHYVKKGGDYALLWKMSDAEKVCPFDLTADFANGSTTITDLDKDGIAETKVQYSLACRSDVSPAYMKLIMHEDTVKYSLRGNMWLLYGPEFKYEITEKNVNLEKLPKPKDESEEILRSFGRYETEKDFSGAPAEFLLFARNEWLKYSKEKMSEQE